ncbi:molybdenum cofactor biosynthesis protein MoaE, partial [Bacillus paranthracis]|nr:molybdenum cofactor biosynthesis protein MoaE [Bacillus paranthracis]
MTKTYYEVIDTEISIEEVANKFIRRECGAVTTF